MDKIGFIIDKIDSTIEMYALDKIGSIIDKISSTIDKIGSIIDIIGSVIGRIGSKFVLF